MRPASRTPLIIRAVPTGLGYILRECPISSRDQLQTRLPRWRLGTDADPRPLAARLKARESRSFAASIAILVLLTGCYSFTGGGLPRHVRTVAVVQFVNTTAQPLIESEIESLMQQDIPRNLGVRLAAEDAADAVVRGRITGYEETAASVRPAEPGERVSVVQRQIRITYEAEIYDMREDQPLWQARSQSVVGNFQPDNESPEIGRTRAVQELVRRVVEGAQSQW